LDDPVEVVAAVVERAGRYLITRRLAGTHLAGLWEFPGGKIRLGEMPEDALKRELREELGVESEVEALIETVDWAYPEKQVRIFFHRCTIRGEPCPQEGQEMLWIEAGELRAYRFPAADARLVDRLAGTR
jgi:8-oxo-dGTP diphosphatase